VNSRFPPPRTPAVDKKKADDTGSANALWRIPEWFPDLSPRVQELLRAYHTELLKFNLKLNLISRNTERDADEAHFADCLLALKCLKPADLGSRIFDVGSGNGLPGIILGILEPEREVELVESDSRKCEFLKHAVHALKLTNVKVQNVRLETLQTANMKVGISRGFASISKTCLACNKIFPIGGQFFHLKGNSWSSEIAEIPSQLISVWTPELVGEYSLPASQARRAVVRTTKRQ
jgi:16S rRNA (guanine527-N7)-methyltransferase